MLDVLSAVERTEGPSKEQEDPSPPNGSGRMEAVGAAVSVSGARRIIADLQKGTATTPSNIPSHNGGAKQGMSAVQVPPPRPAGDGVNTGEVWKETSPPQTFSLADIDAHLHSFYTPSLLSYDPVHTVPPRHTALASSTAKRGEGGRLPARGSTGVGAGSGAASPSSVVTSILKVCSTSDLTSQGDRGEGSSSGESPSQLTTKKSLSFGEDTVRVFKRGSKATALYTEQELLEGKIPSNYSGGDTSDSDSSPPKPKVTFSRSAGSQDLRRAALEGMVNSALSLSRTAERGADSDHVSSLDSDETDSSDLDITPPFENQVRDWLDGGWEHDNCDIGRDKGEHAIPSEGRCSVDKSLPKTYSPHPRIEQVGWTEPAPPPPQDTGLSAADSIKKVNEYKRLRTKSQREARAAASAGGSGRGSNDGRSPPTGGGKGGAGLRKQPRPPVKQADGTVPLGRKVVERGWPGGEEVRVAPLPAPSTSAIEGYEPKHTASAPTSDCPPPCPPAEKEEEEEGTVSVRVAAESMLKGLSLHPFGGGSETYGDAERAQDEKILREIAAEAPGNSGSDDEGEEEGFDNVTRQNFFGDMWMALEDMFGFETISWLNGMDAAETPEELQRGGALEEGDDEGMGSENTEGAEGRHGYLLDAHSLNSHSSMVVHLQRGIAAAERTVNVAGIVACHPALMGKYNECKNRLITSARTQAANPPFNTQQWAFFGLLVIDAVLNKRVLVDAEDEEAARLAKESWNSKYEAFAAGLLGGAEGVRGVLSDREFTILRQFFDVDVAE